MIYPLSFNFNEYIFISIVVLVELTDIFSSFLNIYSLSFFSHVLDLLFYLFFCFSSPLLFIKNSILFTADCCSENVILDCVFIISNILSVGIFWSL